MEQRNNQKPVVITDIDGVALDWLTGFNQYIYFKIKQKIKSWNPWNFDSQQCLPHFRSIEDYIFEYQKMSFYKNLSPYIEALISYQQIKSMGFQLIALSSCGLEPEIVDNRIQNIKNYYFNLFDTIYLLNLQENKQQVLQYYNQVIFIDDQLNNAITASKLGHKAFLINKLYNKNIFKNNQYKITRCYNWQSIIDYCNLMQQDNLIKQKLNNDISIKNII